jgi:outer membrane protein assembly factor BamB
MKRMFIPLCVGLVACPKDQPPQPTPVPVEQPSPSQTIAGAPPQSAARLGAPAQPNPPLTREAPELAWEARIGLTTYKTNILVHGGHVIVGSNGEDRQSTSDPLDGVWVLDPVTGSTRAHLIPPGQGEKDVNGVVVESNRLYFGTDQGMVYMGMLDGSVVWQADIGGDAEASGGLYDADRDGTGDVAIAAEGGDFHVLRGRDGRTLFTIPSSEGDYGQTGFVAPPALYDVTGDGVADVFAPGRDNWLHAVDGATGAPLWSNQHSSGLHGAPVIADTDGDGTPELIYTEAYSELHAVDPATGQLKWGAVLEHPDGGIEGLFGPVTWHPGMGCALVATAWWQELEGMYCVGPEGVYWRYTEPIGNITSGAVIGDVDGRNGFEVVFGTESGKLVAVDGRGEPVWIVEIGAPIEATPTLADIDGDGLLEILVASNDGFLRAFDTRGHAPALLGYHRGSTWNQGVLYQD